MYDKLQNILGGLNGLADRQNKYDEYYQKLTPESIDKIQKGQQHSSNAQYNDFSALVSNLINDKIALFWFYSNALWSKKLDVDMITRINRADIVRCENELCARTSKAGENGYRVIQKRY